MNRNQQAGVVAFATGLVAVVWVALGYVGVNPLALATTVLILACYGAGGLELRRFHAATATLDHALAQLPADGQPLAGWLDRLDPTVRQPVRLRIEGERSALPGPTMTPYLVGLLVLLGMLGTFVGMVVTLKGAVLALESTTDIATIRAALAAPVQGLGLAFGTSVAGVAASAALGLVSALSRRARLQSAQALDAAIAGPLHGHTRAHQRLAAYASLQGQALAMPELVQQLQALMAQMARQGLDLGERLLANQHHFQSHTQSAYTGLAAAVDQTLQRSLSEGARLAAAAIQPVVQTTMAGIARETAQMQSTLINTVREQLDAHGRAFEQGTTALLAQLQQALAAQQAEAAASDGQRQAALAAALDQLAQRLGKAWEQAGEQNLHQQQRVCEALALTARGIHDEAQLRSRETVAEVAALMSAAAQAPRAAAEVMDQLRDKLSDSLARDNAMLEERGRILATLNGLLDTVQHAATQQRGAIDQLVGSTATLLDDVSQRFAQAVDGGAERLGDMAAQIGGSAIEVASLGETFGFAVDRYSASNDALLAHLQSVEAALDKSTTRSDEQLAYYVAQARELIDLSISSQRQIVEDLQQIASKPAAPQASAVA